MSASATSTTDVYVRDEGTVVQFFLNTDAAQAWFAENVQYEPWQVMGRSVVVDHRYAGVLVSAIQENSDLTIR